MTVLENFTYGDTPGESAIAEAIDAILAHDGAFDISTYELSNQCDMRPLVVSTLLTYLELADVIESTGPFYSEYQFVPLKPSREILERFDEERASFLRSVFSCAVKAQKWFRIDLCETALRLETTRERLVAALTFLEEQGDLTLKVAGLRLGYRMKNRPADPEALKRELVERFEARERNDVARVRQMVEFSANGDCLVRHLLAYFGEELGRNCGHCDRCLGEAIPAARSIGPSSDDHPASLDATGISLAIDHGQIRELRAEHAQALASPRQIARFLCGLTSPLLTRTKLTRHPLFGTLAGAPFHQVRGEVERYFS